MENSIRMKIRKPVFAFAFVSMQFMTAIGKQVATRTIAINDTTGSITGKNVIRMRQLILPGAAVAYGFLTLNNNALKDLNQEAKHTFYSDHPHRPIVVDDYLQFAPGGAVLLLSAAGIKGRNRVANQAGVYLLSNLILNATAQSVKRITGVTRPDGTPNSFPSGHAAEAFASAELMRCEYGKQSAWYMISGYSVAAFVATARMYDNRHWLSDVVAGAGLGVISTQAAYWLYPKITRAFSGKQNGTFVYPYYVRGQAGVGLSASF